jgi:hypothetical protein
MKNNLLKIYIAAFFFCSTFVMIAQPGANDTGGTLEDTFGDTTPASPIDVSIWVLVLIGLTFAIFKLRVIYKLEFRLEE